MLFGLVPLVLTVEGYLARRKWSGVVGQVMGWVAAAALAFCAVWPAMWVAPVGTLRSVVEGAFSQGLSPHESSNYFVGSVRPDPGAAFYPIAWLFRTTPWVMIGLATLVRRRSGVRLAGTWGLGLFVVAYLVLGTVSAKKFDRYLLPVFPVLDICAGMGLASLAAAVSFWKGAARKWALPFAAATTLLLLLPAQPYAPGVL